MPATKYSMSDKYRLTLAQLSAYDDILTDILVDRVYYWTTVPKNRPSYHASRGVSEEIVSNIIRDEIILYNDLDAAEEKLLATDGLRKFLNSLKTAKEKEDFKRHLRRYVQIYMPDCPWEVSSTNRYTIVSHEASVTARRYIRRTESIKYLSGIQVVITPEEEQEISMRKKDFSIVVSSRSKSASLFMGPARFANHDCDANAKLITTSHAGIEIVAVRPIEMGEEITVTYGDNYFGEDNCECLCRTCEKGLKNGWKSAEGAAEAQKNIEEEKSEMYSLRRRRRDDSIGSRTSSVTPGIRPRVMRTKPRLPRLCHTHNSLAVASPAPDTSESRKRPIDVMATPPVTPAKKLRHIIESILDITEPLSRSSSVSGGSLTSHEEAIETDITSPERETPEAIPQTPVEGHENKKTTGGTSSAHLTMSAAPSTPESINCFQSPQSSQADSISLSQPRTELSASMSISTAPNKTSSPQPQPDSSIAVSIETVDDSEVAADVEVQVARRKRAVDLVKQKSPLGRVRTPGDYVLTPLLLAEPGMAWIQCTVCYEYFVQQNAYFTRASCPRCERHSKIYGYMWPKTEKTGSSDKEERVLDHRVVHRFLTTSDERKARGRKSLVEPDQTEEEGKPERGRKLERGRANRNAKVIQDVVVVKVQEDTSGLRRSARSRKASSKLDDWY